MDIKINPIRESDLEAGRRLYFDAFPPEERRPWGDILIKRSADERFFMLGIYSESGDFLGFITIWRFADFDYAEHFVISPSLRGQGIGAQAIGQVLVGFSVGRPLVLEAEYAGQSPMASRRLGFYRRCGFTVHDEYAYVQPPYSPDLPSVPLLLLSANGEIDPANVSCVLHSQVYGASPQN